MFWAPTAASDPASSSASRTAARHTNGGQMTLVTPASRVRASMVRASSPASAGVVCIFQLAATMTSRMSGDDARGGGGRSAAHGDRCSGLRLGQSLDAFQRALDRRTMYLEPFGKLGEGRLGRLASGIGDGPDQERLLLHPAVSLEHGDGVELAACRGDRSLEIRRLGVEDAVELAAQRPRDLPGLELEQGAGGSDPAQERPDGFRVLPGHDAAAAAEPP